MKTSNVESSSSLKRWLRDSSIVGLIAAAFMMFGNLPASASCGFSPNVKPGNALEPTSTPAQARQADASTEHHSIVGLWYVDLTLSQNDGGGTLWQSFQQYHADGLELESADSNGLGGNFCMGVWKQEGSTVKIYHVGWTYNGTKESSTEGDQTGSFVLTETNTLSQDGNSFTGTFDVQFFNASGDPTPVQTVSGTLTGKRVDFHHPYTPVPTPPAS